MLKPRLLVLLLAINSALPLKKDTRLGKKPLFPKHTNCETVKCPAVEQPICAKLVYKNAGNRTVYVVMVNKCEMNYVKCHEGLEAVVVSMKNCGHDNFVKSGSKRSKREVADISDDLPPIEHMILKLDDDDEQLQIKGDKDEGEPDNDTNNAKIVIVQGDPPNNMAPNDYDDGNDNEGGDEKENEGNDGGENQDDNDDEEEYYEENEFPEEYAVNSNENYEDNSDYDYEKKMLSDGLGVPLGGDLSAPNSEEVNVKEYYSDCPTVCPSRDVMVCARCQHGVFRTFLTICHMRMFGCRHTDESLELIARRPCVMSAPYLSDVSMQPTGRVREPNDDDRVLRFIRCREKTKMSREGDPRCIFSPDQETKTKETFQMDDNY